MVEIESNKSIREYKQEYILTFGLMDIFIAGVAAACGISAHLALSFLPEVIRGDVCMLIVLSVLCLANYKINNMLLYKLAVKKIGNWLYFGKAIIYTHRREKKHGGSIHS